MHFRYYFSLSILPLFANPVGEKVISGQVHIAREVDALKITQTSEKAIVEWHDFSIGALETTQFIQPSATSAILNRVVGDLPSHIQGTLKANGAVYLVNPQGLILGGRIDATQFIASTFHVPDVDFLEGNLHFTGDSDAMLIHFGEIIADSVTLAARVIREEGMIRAPSGVVKLLVTPSCERIYLIEPCLEVTETARIDVSGPFGGEIELRSSGDLTVEQGANLLGDGWEDSAGDLLLFADGSLVYRGHISLQGLGETGDGGFAEISAGESLQVIGHADLLAAHGTPGTFFLDPGSVTIEHSVSSESGPNTFSDAYINTQLSSGSLTITTASGTDSGNETLTFDNASGNVAISWSAATTFTAVGRRNMTMESSTSIANTNSGSNFDAIVLEGNTTSSTGDFVGVSIATSCALSTVSGNIAITGVGGNTSSDHGISLASGATIASTGVGNITLTGTGGGNACDGVLINGSITTSSAGDITITGTNPGTTGALKGILVSAGTVSASGAGDVTMTGTGGTGSLAGCTGVEITLGSTLSATTGMLTMTGTGGGNGSTTAHHGVRTDNNANVISTTSGDLNITGTGGSGTALAGVQLGISTVTTVDGDITVVGTNPNTTGISNIGVIVAGTIAATGTGDISLTGTSLVTDSLGAYGCRLSGTTTVSTTSGSITLLGNSSGTDDSFFGYPIGLEGSSAIYTTSGGAISMTAINQVLGIGVDPSATIGSGSETGPITLMTDFIDLEGTIQSTGALTIQPYTASTSVGLGTATPGTLNFTDTELANLTDGFSSITFGSSSSTGAVTLAAYTYTDPIVIYGGTITVDGAIDTGANDVILHVGPAGAGTFSLNALVTTTGTVSIQGGSSNDTFRIGVSGQTSTLNGHGGTNYLIGPDSSNRWYITGSNRGRLVSGGGTTRFSNIANLTGGSSDDTFIFSNRQGVTGLVNGGGSVSRNKLDYSLFAPPAIVVFSNSSSGSASNLGLGFLNIGVITGSFTLANATDQIVELLTYPLFYNGFPYIANGGYYFWNFTFNESLYRE